MGIFKNFLIILVIIISSVLKKKIFEEITHAHKKNEGKEKNKERSYIISKGLQQGTCYFYVMLLQESHLLLLWVFEILNSYIFQDLENIDGKRKILLTNYHVTPILEHCKVQG